MTSNQRGVGQDCAFMRLGFVADIHNSVPECSGQTNLNFLCATEEVFPVKQRESYQAQEFRE